MVHSIRFFVTHFLIRTQRKQKQAKKEIQGQPGDRLFFHSRHPVFIVRSLEIIVSLPIPDNTSTELVKNE